MAQLLLDADTAQLRAAVAQACALPDQARTAAKRALQRLRKHIVTTSKRETAAEAKVPQKALSNRYKGEPPDEKGLTIWAGCWNIEPSRVGTPRQTKAGVRVGRWFFPGAFLASLNNVGHPRVYLRMSSRHYNPGVYPGLLPSASRIGARRGDYWRWPIITLRIPIEEPMIKSFEGNSAEFTEFFDRRFAHELTHEAAIRSAPR